MTGSLLVLNSGSSSLKFSLFLSSDDVWPSLLAHGVVDDIGRAPVLTLRDATGATLAPDAALRFSSAGHEAVQATLEAGLKGGFAGHPLRAVGHRVVHGGEAVQAARFVDAQELARLQALSPLAPLHQAHNLAPIAHWLASAATIPQIAAFDTAFHRTIPCRRRRYPIPAELSPAGVERYGFHGLSYEYIAARLRLRDPDKAGGRTIVLHLGAGASACALDQGRSISTSMGFTVLDGLPMATRCGSLDPGLLLYLLDTQAIDVATLRRRLYEDSGLLALSDGLSGDMRVLLASASAAASEAVDHFCWRTRREIGALASELGGLDTLVFTAGIGEHAPEVRAAICEGLGFLGIALDAERNGRDAPDIGVAGARVTVLALPTDEEGMVAWHMRHLLAADPDGAGSARH